MWCGGSSVTGIATIGATGLATGIAQGQTTIQATVGSISGSSALTVTPSRFSYTGSLITPRENHLSAVVSSGKVLITGGTDTNNQVLVSSELYDPITGGFSTTGSMLKKREYCTATLLSNGKVLIVGGWDRNSQTYVSSAELYDPATGAFAYTGSLNIARGSHVATLLNSGLVLIAGGYDNAFNQEASTELYDPSTGTFTLGGNMTVPRIAPTTALLNDGTVLIVAGDTTLAAAEVYNPTAGTFTTVGSLHTGSSYQATILLNSGKVLIAGGYNSSNAVIARAELYDPVAKTFSLTGSLVTARQAGSASLLNNGTVLLAGGYGPAGVLASSELYDPTSGTFSLAGNLNTARNLHSGALLGDGTVLIAGGATVVNANSIVLASAELYQPNASLPVPYTLQVTPAVANVVVGGTQQFTAVDNLGRPRSDATWTASDSNVATITTDSSPILTGVAGGQVMLTANVDGVTAQAQVTISSLASFPDGTVLWATPPVAGFTPLEFDYAVPTRTGPAVYSLQSSSDGTQTLVQALTYDGQQIWQNTLPKLAGPTVPDVFGGLVAIEACDSGNNIPTNIVDLDVSTGQVAWQLPIPTSFNGSPVCLAPPRIAIRHDGAVVVAMPQQISPPVWVLDGKSGAVKSNPPIPASTATDGFGQVFTCDCLTPVGQPAVDGDGSILLEYEVRQIPYPPTTVSSSLWLLRIALDGTTTTTQLSSSSSANLFPGIATPDGSGNVVATWTIVPPSQPAAAQPYQAAYVSSGSVAATYALPMAPTQVSNGPDGLPFNFPLVLGENGTAFASYGSNIVSFDRAAGAVHWSYPAPTQSGLSILSATVGSGLAAKIIDQTGAETILQLDSTGAGTIGNSGGSQFRFSWEGSWNAYSNGSFAGVSGSQVPVAGTFWALGGGNHSGNGMAVEQVLTNQPQGVVKQLSASGPVVGNINLIDIHTTQSPDYIFQTYLQTYAGLTRNPNDNPIKNSVQYFSNSPLNPGYTSPDIIDVTAPNQVLTITLRRIPGVLQDPFSVMTERVDTVNHVISVVTLQGHPLAGWRYWTVYSVGANEVIIETGAYDGPGPGLKNFVGYFLAQGTVSRGWRELLEYLQKQPDLNAVPMGLPVFNLAGRGPVSIGVLRQGLWDNNGIYTNYILNNVCQSIACN